MATEIELDELLIFEKWFNGDESISQEDLYFLFQLLRQTKDLKDSKHIAKEGDNTKFEMVYMHIKRVDEGFSFNGTVSNGSENRCISGLITKKGKSYYVSSYIERLGNGISLDIKNYHVYDSFKQIKDNWYQESFYDESAEYRKVHGESKLYKEKIAGIDLEEFDKFKKYIGKHHSF